MNYNKLLEKVQSKLFKEQEPQPKIGATIKLKRKEQQKTLLELSEKTGVSLSYISKVENDQLKPNLKHIRAILKDLSIEEDLFHMSSNMTDWYEYLIDYMLGIEDDEKKLVDLIEQREDFQAKLMDLALSVKTGYLGHSEAYISLLVLSIENMKPIEVAVFLLTLAEYHSLCHQKEKVADLLSLLHKKKFDNPKIDLWLLKLTFELSIYTGDYHYIEFCFNAYTKQLVLYGLLDHLMDARNLFMHHVQLINHECIKPIGLFEDSYDYLMQQKYQMFFQKRYHELIEQIHLEDQSRYALLLCLSYDALDNQEMVNTILKNKESIIIDSIQEKLFLNYLENKHDDHYMGSFLKHTLYKVDWLFYHIPLLKWFETTYINFLENKHRYKEATIVRKDMNERYDLIHRKFKILPSR